MKTLHEIAAQFLPPVVSVTVDNRGIEPVFSVNETPTLEAVKIGPREEELRRKREEESVTVSFPTLKRQRLPREPRPGEPIVKRGPRRNTGIIRKHMTGTKIELIGRLLTRPEGCTRSNVLAATGWQSVSMPRRAAQLGLKLRREKVEGITRYYGC